jgi:hypothetical protein
MLPAKFVRGFRANSRQRDRSEVGPRAGIEAAERHLPASHTIEAATALRELAVGSDLRRADAVIFAFGAHLRL